jgi:spermidine synthase
MRSAYSGRVELTRINGKLRLDTSKVNYSYGSLQRILKRALREVNLSGVGEVLLLGLGGGSVVQTLRDDFDFTGNITAVDIDPLMVSLAGEVFHIGSYYACNIYCEDALHFIENDAGLYDLIIVDIFIDDVIPPGFMNDDFWKNIIDRLHKGGYVIFNTIRKSAGDLERIEKLLIHYGFNVKILRFLEQTNDVLIGNDYL